jgi:hypothetical protein
MISPRPRHLDATLWLALLIWLIVQLAAIGLCAARFSLWARAPQAMEQLALAVLLAVQVGAASLIFTHLLSNGRGLILAIASAWPMAELASFLSDTPWLPFLRGESFVTVWLISLWLWRKAFPKPQHHLLLTATASLVSFGAPILWYLRADFRTDSATIRFDSLWHFGPMCGAVAQLFSPPELRAWVALAIVFLAGLLISMVNSPYWTRSRQVIHE